MSIKLDSRFHARHKAEIEMMEAILSISEKYQLTAGEDIMVTSHVLGTRINSLGRYVVGVESESKP